MKNITGNYLFIFFTPTGLVFKKYDTCHLKTSRWEKQSHTLPIKVGPLSLPKRIQVFHGSLGNKRSFQAFSEGVGCLQTPACGLAVSKFPNLLGRERLLSTWLKQISLSHLLSDYAAVTRRHTSMAKVTMVSFSVTLCNYESVGTQGPGCEESRQVERERWEVSAQQFVAQLGMDPHQI